MFFKNVLYSPLASLVLVILSNNFFMTFITVHLKTIGVQESIIGYIHAAFYFGMLVGAVKCESIVNRVGHIRGYAFFSSLMTISVILQAHYTNPYIWVLFRFIGGIAISGVYVVIESWLLAQSTSATKGKILSIYMLCLYLSQTVSQFFIDVVDIKTIEPFLLAAVLSSLAVIPASLTYVTAPAIETTKSGSLKRYFTDAPLGFIGCTISGLMLASIYGFMPQYALEFNYSVSILLGTIIAGGFVLQIPIGKMSDKFDRAIVICLIALGSIVFSLMVLFVQNEIYVYILSFFLGGLCFTIYPVSIAYACDRLEGKVSIVALTGALLFAYGIGAVLGSPIIAQIIQFTNASSIFVYLSGCAFLLSVICIVTLKKAKPVEVEAQVEFVAMPRATPVANQLDPRSE